MTLSKSEEIKRKRRKTTRLYLRKKHYIVVDKEPLTLLKLTKAFFQCKSLNLTIKGLAEGFIKGETPFGADDNEMKLYRDYIKQYNKKSNPS